MSIIYLILAILCLLGAMYNAYQMYRKGVELWQLTLMIVGWAVVCLIAIMELVQ